MDLANPPPSSPEPPERRRRIRLAVILAVVGLLLAGPFGLLDATINGPSPKNLLTLEQQNFETGSAGWSGAYLSSIRSSSTIAHNGNRSLRIQARARSGATLASSSASTDRGTAGIRVTAGTSYDGSIRVHAGLTPRTARCELRWWKADGTELGTSLGAPVTARTDAWTQARCTARAPSGAATVALRVVFPTVGSSEVHFADDAWLTVTPSNVVPPRTTPARSFATRINVAAISDLVAPDGTRFTADSGYVGGTVSGNIGSTIAGTDNDALYAKHRWGMSGYSIPVPASGTYTVRLHLAETVFRTSGQRVFDVSAEGTIRQNDLDVFAAAGADTALVRQFDVPVSDGNLNLGFTAVVEDPMISGIEVLGTTGVTTAASTTTTAPPTTTTAAPTTTTTAPAPPPSPGGYPNASNTGPSGALAPSGSITTSANGQVIQNLDINGSVRVQHNNVTIRNVRIRSHGQAISILGNTGLLVEDCELDGNNADSAAAIGDHNYTMRRCEVYRHGEGPRINGNVVVEDSYFHTFPDFISRGAHQDCIQITSGSNIVIRHNTCMMNVDGANAAIMTGSYSGNNLLFENNLLAGGGYTVYCGDNQYTNVTVRNNRFSTAYYPRGGYHGPFVSCSQAALSGNVWHDGPNAGRPAS